MGYLEKLDGYLSGVSVSGDVDALVKVAEDDGIPQADLIGYHNLMFGDPVTGENMIKVAEDADLGPLFVAFDCFDKLAADEITDDEAVARLEEAGLTPDDFNEIAEMVEKKASVSVEPGALLADSEDSVVEKIAETYDWLAAAGINPVEAIAFAEDFQSAPDADAQDKIAGEYDDLDEDVIDKIAEAAEYLSDIQGVAASVLMADMDDLIHTKEASVLSSVGKKISEIKMPSVKGTGQKLKQFGENLTGAGIRKANRYKKLTEEATKKAQNASIGNNARKNRLETLAEHGKKMDSNLAQAKKKTLSTVANTAIGLGAAGAVGSRIRNRDK